MPIGTSATSLLMTGATLPDDVQGTPLPRGYPKIYHFVRARLCRARVQHNDQFQPLNYKLQSSWLCKGQDPMGCQLTASKETVCLLELPQMHS